MYYFIAVNYGTHQLIEKWLYSINDSYKEDKVFIIVDNYKNKKERINVQYLSQKLNFILIESENKGYGNALNKGIEFVLKNAKEESIIFAGNLDLIYKNIPENLPRGEYVYVPIVKEGKRNRNPFLTKLQKKFIFIYKFAGYTQSPLIYYIVVLINKIIGLFPSKIWAVHGSLFCFNSSILKVSEKIFNDKSFLYGEELEFASFMEFKNAKFISSKIVVEHISHVATSKINKSTKDFLKLWWPSFKNWIYRWNKK